MSALVLIFTIPWLNKEGFYGIVGTFYSMRIAGLDVVDPALVLQYYLLTGGAVFSLILAGLIPAVLALLLGKVFCGWLCPFNLMSEFADKIFRRVRRRPAVKPNRNPRPFVFWLIFCGLLLLVFFSGLPLIALASMPGVLSGQAADWVFKGTLGLELFFVVLVVTIEVFFKKRFWCNYVCPAGAALALFRFPQTLSVRYNSEKCVQHCAAERTNINICNAACPLHLNPRQKGLYPFCFNCGACVQACYTKGGRLILPLNRKPKKYKPVGREVQERG